MKSKMMASRQYAANQFGVSNGEPSKRQERREARQATRGGGKSGDAVEVCTAKTAKEGKCSAYGGGGPSTGTVQKAKNTKPSAGGEKNKVMSKKEAASWGKEIGKVKQNAPAMKNLTKKQKEAQNFVGPPTPSYVKKKK